MDNDRLKALEEGGVKLISPQNVFVADDVDISHIEEGVTIYPGCRISGRSTSIGKDSEIGREAPATIEDCAIGGKVQLKGGYFKNAVFLDGSSMGSGAHVREGSLLEEEANAAHTVGLKQTILFPFVTLGSLINFCDCMMSGGTSRKDHSEVGSSYIHFNFTPNMDKVTASMIGDVPRGVFLRERPIFLGGQGGLVGPSRIGFGSMIASGIVYKGDLAEAALITGAGSVIKESEFKPGVYFEIKRKVRNNISYIAGLIALKAWYISVRSMFLNKHMLKASIRAIDSGLDERISRLKALASKMPESVAGLNLLDRNVYTALIKQQEELYRKWDETENKLNELRDSEGDKTIKQGFLSCINKGDMGYTDTIKALDGKTAGTGTSWLYSITNNVETTIDSILDLFS